MQLRIHQPGPALAPYVDYLWQLRDLPVHSSERVLPSGTLELVINLAHDGFQVETSRGPQRLRGALVSGVYQRFFCIDTRDHADVLGVHFKPAGAWPILGTPPGHLADTHVDLEDLWSAADARRLRLQLMAANEPQRLPLLEAALTARRLKRRVVHPACAHAVGALSNGCSVREVADAVGMSARRMQTLFREQIGTTPKRYARLRRLQRALAHLRSQVHPDWSALALACGYFDQSHMIREFQALSGCTPAQWSRAQETPVKEHHVALR